MTIFKFLLLLHLNRRLKLAYLILICLLSVVVVVVANFSQFFFYSRITRPISIKLGKVIQVCSNEGSCTFPMRDNNEGAKIH